MANIKNVGIIDRVFRALLALFLIWIGLTYFNGIQGSIFGIIVASTSLMPIYMSATGSCFIFRWFNIHSLSKNELKIYGNPLRSDKNNQN